MMLLFKYYNSKTVSTITQEEIGQYIVFIKTVHKVGRAKCRSVASACAFFYKQVIKMPYVLPSALYPQKQFILLEYHEPARSNKTVCSPPYFKTVLCNRFAVWQRPLRISEVTALCVQDIESASKRIKVVQGKGAKDRYTLLAGNLLDKLRQQV